MKRILIAKGMTLKTKTSNAVKDISGNKCKIQRGVLIDVEEVLYSEEACLCVDRSNDTKYIVPHNYILKYCEIINTPKYATISGLYFIKEEVKDKVDLKHFVIAALVINAIALITNVGTHLYDIIMQLCNSI